jgi:hypothetical protein
MPPEGGSLSLDITERGSVVPLCGFSNPRGLIVKWTPSRSGDAQIRVNRGLILAFTEDVSCSLWPTCVFQDDGPGHTVPVVADREYRIGIGLWVGSQLTGSSFENSTLRIEFE